MSSSLIDLKKKQSVLLLERSQQMKTKCDIVRNTRIQQYKEKSQDLDQKERELCRKTNQLVDELVSTCGDTEFHKALIKVLSNLKGIIFINPDGHFCKLRLNSPTYILLSPTAIKPLFILTDVLVPQLFLQYP